MTSSMTRGNRAHLSQSECRTLDVIRPDLVAHRLERIVREASNNSEHDRIAKIVYQLCHDYAYVVNQAHARNGGLIGLAAASIALGSVSTDQALRVWTRSDTRAGGSCQVPQRNRPSSPRLFLRSRCTGQILCLREHVQHCQGRQRRDLALFQRRFRCAMQGRLDVQGEEYIWLTLRQLAADAELSVKNGAELLDRLVKDIVSESAATYVSVLQSPEEHISDKDSMKASVDSTSIELPTAFSLARFIPLLQERIHVLSPFTRTFLVSWVTLLDTIPDLELVYYLPAFLGGLFKFLSDPNRDVHVATQGALERFLTEIKKIARVKRGIEESRKFHSDGRPKTPNSVDSASVHSEHSTFNEKSDVADGDSGAPPGSHDSRGDGDWVPGQDVQVDHARVLEILVTFLDSPSGT